jgi:phosphopantothenoylcysteine decarboxylase/phosphopantothenate--cysteine ligase
MGIAIADEAFKRGAKVILVLGPVDQHPHSQGIKIVNVLSADEMAKATKKHFSNSDVTILAAAVADYTPESVSGSKIKKKNEGLMIRLKPTTDIAAELGKIKKTGKLLVGFALETENEQTNALDKLKRKNLDLIVLNSLRDKGAGFRSDTNKVSFIDKNNIVKKFELKSKAEVASDILDKIETIM